MVIQLACVDIHTKEATGFITNRPKATVMRISGTKEKLIFHVSKRGMIMTSVKSRYSDQIMAQREP
jgi:hypothetical protein